MSNDPKTSIQNGNLDITMVPNEDLEKLSNCIEGFYKQDSTVKSRLAYNWDRNHQFLDDNQWLTFTGDRDTGGQWNRLTVSKENEYVPRPVTNYLFDCYQTLKSYLTKTKPTLNVRPNTNRNRDKQAAKIAELIAECNYESLQEQDNYEYAAACLLTYGTVFKKDYWDTTSVSTVRVPVAPQSPIQNANQEASPVGPDGLPVEGALSQVEPGLPEFQEMPLGDVNTEICEPYRIALDPLATGLHKAKWIMEYSIQALDVVKDVYSSTAPGYTGLAADLKEETTLSGSMRRFVQLKNSSGVKNQFGEGSSGKDSGNDTNLTNSVVVKEYYERPSRRNPRGRMVVVASGKTLYVGESPYSGPDLGDWHPYSECRWEILPGRFWGKSPLDPAVEIQKHINSIDSAVILNRKTMAAPQKLIPAGSGIAKGQWTGRPAQQIEYRDTGANKPEIIKGSGMDSSVFKEREQKVEDLKTVTGAIDILKGISQPGVTAASAMNLQYEVGTGKLFPVLDRWKKFNENSAKKQLRLVASKYREPRPEFAQKLLSRNSALDPHQLENFLGSDLYDNCNVVIEVGSNVPKLLAAKQAQLMESAQVGTLNLDSPANRMEFNKQMGITGFDNDVEPDVQRAEWMNDLLDDVDAHPENMQLAVVLAMDDDQVHLDILGRRMKEPSFMSASPAVQQAYNQKYMEYTNAKAQKDQMMMMEAAMTGQPPGQAQSANDPQQPIQQGSGAPNSTSESLFADAKVPGSPE